MAQVGSLEAVLAKGGGVFGSGDDGPTEKFSAGKTRCVIQGFMKE